MLLKNGSKGKNVKKLQGGLKALSSAHSQPAWNLVPDGGFGKKSEAAVKAFQAWAGLGSDGKAGTNTIKRYNDELIKLPGHEIYVIDTSNKPSLDAMATRTVKADKWRGSGLSSWAGLRSDCADSLDRIKKHVNDHGGVLTSAGGMRKMKKKSRDPKKNKIGSAQSTTSFHTLRSAIDLAVPHGLTNVAKNPFIVIRDPDRPRGWLVYAKVVNESAPLAHEVAEVTLEACYVKGWKKTKLMTKSWTGKAFLLTQVFRDEGWEPISGRKSFFRGGSAIGSEWWHFSYLKPFEVGTTYGDALRDIYGDKATQYLFWPKVKNRRYNGRGSWSR